MQWTTHKGDVVAQHHADILRCAEIDGITVCEACAAAGRYVPAQRVIDIDGPYNVCQPCKTAHWPDDVDTIHATWEGARS